MTAMNANLEKKTVWWREPMVWLIMGLPMTAVIAGLTTVWIAYSHADTVLSDYDSQGIDVAQAHEMDQRAHYMALSALMNASHGYLTLSLDGRRASARPAGLTLRIIHLDGAGTDTLLALQPGHDGTYATRLPAMRAGPCKVILESDDRKWRLAGHWLTPFNGPLHLAAKSISDSSMLP
jgi:hypothetical protein